MGLTLRGSGGPGAGHTRLVPLLIIAVASGAAVLVAATADGIRDAVADDAAAVAGFAVLALALQLAAGLYGRGSMSVAGVAILGCGFTLGTGPAAALAVACAGVHFVRRRSRPERALFTAGTLALAAGAGVAVYALAGAAEAGAAVRVAGALGAGAVSWAVNIGLLTAVMSLSESRSPTALWRERFRWLTAHYIAFGPLALAATIAYEQAGVVGIFAFALPPAVLALSVRQTVERRRAALDLGLG